MKNPTSRRPFRNASHGTATRQAEDLLSHGAPQLSTVLLQLLLEHTTDIIHVLDAEGRIRFISSSVERILGYAPQELIGRVGHEVVHPDDRALAESTFEQDVVRGGGASRSLELRLRHRDGSWRTFAVEGRMVDAGGGKTLGIVTSHDITDRKRAETDVLQLSEELRALVEASPLPIVTLDRQGRVTQWSQACERVFGWSAEEVTGKPLPIVPERSMGEFDELRERVLRGETLSGYETDRCRKDGSSIPVSISTAPVYDRSGTAVGVMAVVEDITERRRLEQQRSQVLQFVSHDLHSPLSGILVAASHAQMLIRSEGIHGEVPKLVAGIVRSAEAMTALIRDILDSTRIDAGGLLLQPEVCSVADTLRDTATMYRPLAREQGIQLVVDPSPALFVRADPHRLLQVLSNLVSNALRFTPQGGRITLNADEVGDEIQFSVADTGQGIAEADLPHIFERYWQGSGRGSGNTGLGLTIAKGVVEAHGGRIWVESRLGEGTAFHFVLPPSRIEVPEPPSEAAAAARAGGLQG